MLSLRRAALLLACVSLRCNDAPDASAPDASAAPGGQAGSSPASAPGGSAGTTPGGQAGAPASAGSGGDGGAAGTSDALEVLPAMFVAKGVDLDPIEEGEAIPLSLPPQGGHVLWIGAYFRNLLADTIELRARLRDPETGELVAEEGRTVAVRPVEGQPGLFQPDIRTVSQVTHVPACPVYESRPIAERAYLLEVTVRELYVEPQRTAKGTRTVVPSCEILAEPYRPLCRCECEGDYVLGKCKDIPQPPPLQED